LKGNSWKKQVDQQTSTNKRTTKIKKQERFLIKCLLLNENPKRKKNKQRKIKIKNTQKNKKAFYCLKTSKTPKHREHRDAL